MSAQDLTALGQTGVASCGNCRFSKRKKEDLTMIECHGAPPSPIVLPAPGGVQVQFVWPNLPALEPAGALHQRKLEVLIGGKVAETRGRA